MPLLLKQQSKFQLLECDSAWNTGKNRTAKLSNKGMQPHIHQSIDESVDQLALFHGHSHIWSHSYREFLYSCKIKTGSAWPGNNQARLSIHNEVYRSLPWWTVLYVPYLTHWTTRHKKGKWFTCLEIFKQILICRHGFLLLAMGIKLSRDLEMKQLKHIVIYIVEYMYYDHVNIMLTNGSLSLWLKQKFKLVLFTHLVTPIILFYNTQICWPSEPFDH